MSISTSNVNWCLALSNIIGHAKNLLISTTRLYGVETRPIRDVGKGSGCVILVKYFGNNTMIEQIVLPRTSLGLKPLRRITFHPKPMLQVPTEIYIYINIQIMKCKT